MPLESLVHGPLMHTTAKKEEGKKIGAAQLHKHPDLHSE